MENCRAIASTSCRLEMAGQARTAAADELATSGKGHWGGVVRTQLLSADDSSMPVLVYRRVTRRDSAPEMEVHHWKASCLALASLQH